MICIKQLERKKNEWFFLKKYFYTLFGLYLLYPDWSLFTLSSISFVRLQLTCNHCNLPLMAFIFVYKYFEWQFIHSNEYYRQLNAYLNASLNGCQNIQQKLHKKQHTRLM